MVVYNRFIRPYFLKHQGDIDQAVDDLTKKGKEKYFTNTLTKNSINCSTNFKLHLFIYL